MKITDIRIDGFAEHMGVDTQVCVSWKLEGEGQNAFQKAYQIKVQLPDGTVCKTERVESSCHYGVELPQMEYQSFQSYLVQVMVEDEALKDYVVHTHVKDVALSKPGWKDRLLPGERTKDGQVMKCCVFGQGVIPLKEILQRMESDGYQGVYALEYSHPEKFPADFAQHTKRMQEHIAFLKTV